MQLKHGLTTCLVAAGLLTPGLALSEVVLKTEDGLNSIRGDLIEFDEGKYTIKSALGTIIIDANVVTCEGEECPEIDRLDQIIRVAGPASLLSGLMPGLVADYAKRIEAKSKAVESDAEQLLPDIEIMQEEARLATFKFSPLSQDAAFAALLNGEADVVISDRRIADTEIDQFLSEGLGDLTLEERETVIAQDAYLPLVSINNPISQLTVQQFVGMLSGAIENWSEVGGADAAVNVYRPPSGTAISDEFERSFLIPDFLTFAESAQRLPEPSDVGKAVAEDPYGVGLGNGWVPDDARLVKLVADCGLPIRLDPFALKSEDSLFSRRIYLYTTGRNDQPSRAVKFALSARQTSSEGALNSPGFINLSPVLTDIAQQGHQLAYALAEPALSPELGNLRVFSRNVLDAERSSITFRFGLGSSQLDNKSLSDAIRLIGLLGEIGYEDREIMLVGFTDSLGGSDINRILSLRRAEQVLNVVSALADDSVELDRIKPLGFGAAYPIACNTTEAGRQLNRRVEVWVK